MARYEEQDFDEKRLARRQRRKQSQLIAYIILTLIIVFIAVAIGVGIHFVSGYIKASHPEEESVLEASSEETSVALIETPQESAEPVEYSEEDLSKEIIDSILSEMTLEDKVAGLFIVTPEQLTGVETAVKAGSGTQEALAAYAVGGIVYAPKNIKSTDQIKEMLDDTASMSKYPVFTILSASSRASDAVISELSLTPDEEITDSVSAHSNGLYIGSQLFKYGFNFAADPLFDISEDGSFGAEPGDVKENASAYALGLKESGVTSCGYFFPSKADTTTGTVSIDISKDDLVLKEYEAFKKALDEGCVGAVMMTNASFPQVTGDETPSSLSGVMISEELRGTLGFDGIVITSPLNEGAITQNYSSGDAAVAAINAGADMLYIPDNFTEGYEALLSAVQSGSISEERINESIRRIYKIKYADRVNQISQGE